MSAKAGQCSATIGARRLSIKMGQPKIGIFSFTSCSGCQMEILDLEEELLTIAKLVDIAYFPMAQEKNKDGPFDVVFIEGSIISEEQEKELKEIREKSKVLVALGTCATAGGVQSMKDLMDIEKAEREVYHRNLNTRFVYGIDNFVKVDYFIRGCPPVKEEFVSMVLDLARGKKPRQKEDPVCVECRKKGNRCMLLDKKPCIGPITYGGCDALCPSDRIACYGCRGPLADANVSAEANMLKNLGFKKEDIGLLFEKFAGTSKVLKEYGKDKP